MASTATSAGDGVPAPQAASSFAKSLFLGEIHDDLVFPYPCPDEEEERVSRIVAALEEFADGYDERAVEDARWVSGRHVITRLGEIGALGLYVPGKYEGQGLSQTGYARVFEAIAGSTRRCRSSSASTSRSATRASRSSGRTSRRSAGSPTWRPAASSPPSRSPSRARAPTPGTSQSRAVRQPDGSYVLNGEKRYIGNGSRADVLTTFARCEVDGKDRHIALLVEKGMKGFEVGDRYDTMGLRANDLRRLFFNDVRIPPENVLGEPGEGFRIAMAILNNGRIGLGTGSVGGAKMLIDMAIAHVTDREQFGAPLADLELVQEKIGWMVSYLFGVESMCYLTTGLVDARRRGLLAGVGDLQDRRDRVPLVPGEPRAAARRRRGLHAHGALREDPARHPDLPDLRGRQRRAALVRRAERDQAARREARRTRQHRPRRPDRLARRAGRLRRRAHPAGQDHGPHRGARTQCRRRHRQVKRLRSICEKLLREHRARDRPQGPSPPPRCPTRSPTSSPRSR